MWNLYVVQNYVKIGGNGQEETFQSEKGFITVTRERRMFVIIVRGARPKPESLAKMTDQQRNASVDSRESRRLLSSAPFICSISL